MGFPEEGQPAGSEGSEDVSPEAVADLDDWAAKGDARAESRARRPDGKFAKGNGDSSYDEAERVLAETQRQVEKDAKRFRNERRGRPADEEEEDEPKLREEDEEPVDEPKPKPKGNRKVKALVNGQEEVIDLDDAEYQKINSVQAMRASQKAFREAAQLRKEAEQLKDQINRARANVKQDPMKLFKALGISEEDVAQFAQNMTINKLSETIDPVTGQPYTPEQQKIIQLQNQLKTREQQEAEIKQQNEAAEFEKVKEVVRQDIDRKFTAALQETGLPTTPYTMMRLADIMENLGPDVDPMTVAPVVVEDMVNEFSSVANGFPIEVVAEILGEKFLNKLRKWDIERARKGRDKFGRNPQRLANNADKRIPPSSRKTTNFDEANEWLDKWAGQR
jgi:hypothetical protein